MKLRSGQYQLSLDLNTMSRHRCSSENLGRGTVQVWAAKGFAKKQKKSSNKGQQGQQSQGKKMQKTRGPLTANPMAPQQPSPNSRDEQFLTKMEQMQDGTKEEQDEFKKRIADLKARGQSLKSMSMDESVDLESKNGSSPLDGPLSGSSKPPQKRREIRSEEEEDSKTGLGIPQLAVGFITLALAAVFIFTSGSVPGPSGSSNQESEISEEGIKALKERASELEASIKENSGNTDAQRELLDVTAILGDNKKSRDIAEQLVKIDEKNADFWLALGEARNRLKDWKGAASAFEKSVSLTENPTLSQYQGMAGALVSNKQFSEAVEKLQSYEFKAKGGGESAGPVEIQLLIAKVYSQWDKHFSSALAVYDGLLEKYPDDFRIYLAKGKLLKDNGRKGDATRMFIQAKYLAPQEARAAVDQISNK